MPLPFDPTSGGFRQRLDLSRDAAGAHTLTIIVQDSAGLRGDAKLER